MQIVEVTDPNSELIERLVAVWESSVRATHLFLTDDEIRSIKKVIPEAIVNVQHLIVMKRDDNDPIGFMGVNDQMLEMLFISDQYRGKGLGKQLFEDGLQKYSINQLGVNEQNPLARGFYEHMGFKVYQRTELDEQGNHFPILYMKKVDDD
ncbi:putative N-acetyltransferase YjaB [Lentilactobacillus parabuchneri]|jgi:putative acetyltransferase|uniref:GNAT family N-acetyltransferase n=2 Tax=Lentilactobacillus parabuchneri TaxID=152331 RepID=A0A1X1FCV6_9LACO|nr:GNAT family N-acetyltransferase [Lentilactobacillus parabuchneri]APR08199.1 putative N-acetyltransferase YjaB [Lentilactobacillus parabuchneri]KRM46715.1 N-acetyltransferase GCN5 [Lentilactobacillus parabuchneri DSM 5707 = NBRC 107865]KRN76380.1 N-acetyltransferase GCN5 [Lentilactobacillus parabuchneri]MBW0222457.1 GNAT family N-acetyltransferase [Lentilactobacillus parabuchneri]MBW0244642.1 GNAT family N-acetyltransferase [Lentilactobacillus parabuchneri]